MKRYDCMSVTIAAKINKKNEYMKIQIINGPNLNLLGTREPGIYTSIALHDCIRAIACPVVEVHISNVFKREDFRHHSFLSPACLGVICGFGLHGYAMAIDALIDHHSNAK